jgi:hypothetical protein
VIRRLTPVWRLRATCAAVTLPPLVHLVAVDRINRWITGGTRRLDNYGVDDRALADWVDRVLTRLPRPWKRTCLKRALVMHYLIHRAGRESELRIGVRRDDTGALVAHAWLTRRGAAYLEPLANNVATYSVVTTLTSTGGIST